MSEKLFKWSKLEIISTETEDVFEKNIIWDAILEKKWSELLQNQQKVQHELNMTSKLMEDG